MLDDIFWWVGMVHLVAYALVGTAAFVAFCIHKALRYFGYYRLVYRGLRAASEKDRTPG